MLSQTVKENLKEIQNCKMRNKTTKYSSLFSSKPTIEPKESKFKQLLMKDGLVEVEVEDELYQKLKEREEIIQSQPLELEGEEADFIVENPNEIVVNFSDFMTDNSEEKLPFFKSLSIKLTQFEG